MNVKTCEQKETMNRANSFLTVKMKSYRSLRQE